MSAGAAIIKPAYSKIASAPTKLGEYLGCGVPCIGNNGVGDVEQILEDESVGVSLAGFSSAELQKGVDRLVALAREGGIASRCRSVAERLFSLETGVAAYRSIYRELTYPAGHEVGG
jgi:glycosyltransferase involved in cell wall biosynthesis